jgi:hypothetical protein
MTDEPIRAIQLPIQPTTLQRFCTDPNNMENNGIPNSTPNRDAILVMYTAFS